jgi:hypothetical protein
MAPKIVQARYLGDTPVVMPGLLELDRPETDEAEAAWVEGGQVGINPRCYVAKGDVVPIDDYSAEGRADFEPVKPKAASKKES